MMAMIKRQPMIRQRFAGLRPEGCNSLERLIIDNISSTDADIIDGYDPFGSWERRRERSEIPDRVIRTNPRKGPP